MKMRNFSTASHMKYSFLILILYFGTFQLIAQKFQCRNGQISFTSDAPLELIKAGSNALKGAIEPEQMTFAFAVKNRSFRGFNSPLQEEHFNEDYIESPKNEHSTFTGKIIDKVDWTKNGKATIRAKGILTVHGVAQERIIKSDIEIRDKKLMVKAQFTVLLADHNIAIPKIVFQKIAEEVQLFINAEFILQ
jgi:YceI-like domain